MNGPISSLRRLLTVVLSLFIIWSARESVADDPQEHQTAQSSLDAISNQVAAFIPRFSGPDPIGQNISTLLHLQIWRTLRKAPYPNPRGLDFGQGMVYYSTASLVETTAIYADNRLKQIWGQMVLWGDVIPYVDGVIVQALLSMPEYADARREHGEIWQVRFGNNLVELGLPRRVIEFAPIILRPEVAARVSTPDALRLCPVKTKKCGGPSIGPAFKAIGHEGPWSHVVTGYGLSGWVYLPELGDSPNEVAVFTAGMISYFRKDFEQSSRLFEDVLHLQAPRSPVRMDALLLQAASLSRYGRTKYAEAVLKTASEFNPYSRYVLQARIMNAIAGLGNQGREVARTVLAPYATELMSNRRLFEDKNSWLEAVEGLFAHLGLPAERTPN